jgi:hypothetical protein
MSDGNIIGDSTGRFLHAYVDTLQLFGVSRLRLSKPERLPRTSVLMYVLSVSLLLSLLLSLLILQLLFLIAHTDSHTQ